MLSNLTKEELWQFFEDLVSLGKIFTYLDIETDFPDIPALEIKGGKMGLKRFIYWHFIKCFWNPELDHATSVSTNFDWYSPVNDKRFSKEDIKKDLILAKLNQVIFLKRKPAIQEDLSKINFSYSIVYQIKLKIPLIRPLSNFSLKKFSPVSPIHPFH